MQHLDDVYLAHNPKIQGASITFDPSSFSCNVPNVSKWFSSSGMFCWLLHILASIHLLWNSIPFVIYSYSHCRRRFASRICYFHQARNQQTEWFPKNIWIIMIYIIFANDITCNVPCSNATLHPTQLKNQVDCHLNLISSQVNPTAIVYGECITVYDHIKFRPLWWSWSRSLKLQPSVIFLLHLQHTNFYINPMPPKIKIQAGAPCFFHNHH